MLRSNSVRVKTVEIIIYQNFFLTKKQYIFLKYSEKVYFLKQEIDNGEKGSPVDFQGGGGFRDSYLIKTLLTFIFSYICFVLL